MPDRPPRRFRFGIRVLMLAILAAGLCLGDRVHRAREQRLAVAAVKASGGWVHYADEFVMVPVNVSPGNALWKPRWGALTPGKGPAAPGWVRRWLGDEYLREVVHVSLFVDIQKGMARNPMPDDPPVDDVLLVLGSQTGVRTLQSGGATVTDKGLASVGRMTGLEELMIWGARGITDAGAAHLSRLRRLRTIDIRISSLTDEGVGHLADLPALEELKLQGRKFTDVSLSHLARAKRLESLDLRTDLSGISDDGLAFLRGMNTLKEVILSAPNVTDKGLEHLKGLKGLRRLYLGNSNVTKEGREQLLKAIPNLEFIP